MCIRDRIDIAHGKFQPVAITHIADEIAHEGILFHREHLLHFELLEFVPAEDDEPARLVFFDDGFDKMLAERARAAGDEHRLFVEVQPGLREIAKVQIGAWDCARNNLGCGLRHG